MWWLIPRGNGGEKEQRRETSVGKECSFARALSLSSLSLSLSFLACTRAFLSSKVALSENLSQIHQNCGREGNETRLLMREKDFERYKFEEETALLFWGNVFRYLSLSHVCKSDVCVEKKSETKERASAARDARENGGDE